MEKWEEEGFASEEAYNKHQQTVKDLEEAKGKLESRVNEGQELIGKHRSEISDLKKTVEELQKKADEVKPPKAPPAAPEKTPEQEKAELEANNKKRLLALTKEEREAYKGKYLEATAEQKALLDTPEGLAAYLDLSAPKSTVKKTPFDVEEETPKESIEDRVRKAFKLADPSSTPPNPERKGAGFTPTEKAKKAIDVRTAAIKADRDKLLR